MADTSLQVALSDAMRYARLLELTTESPVHSTGVLSVATVNQIVAELRRLAAVEAELERIKALEPVAEIRENRYGGRETFWFDNQKAATMPFGTHLYALGSKTA